MATAYAEQARKAFVDDDFQLAVDLYTTAVDLDANNADLFAERAQAHMKLDNFTEAVSDASKAIKLDPSMAKAYLRKGAACMKLEEYHTAKETLEKGLSLAQDASRFTKLIEECKEHISEEVIEEPTENISSSKSPTIVSDESSKIMEGEESGKGQGSPEQTTAISLVKPRYRHEFYQKPEEVVVTIFAKHVAAKDITVDFGEQILSVSIEASGEDAYHFQPRLYAKIIPEKCKYHVLSTKVEIRLAKAEPIQWKSLEYSKEAYVATAKVKAPSVVSGRPVYPSSKNGAQDWDKLEAQVKKEEKEEQLDGDAGLNKLFRDIYQNADEEMRRAMTKSFMESNGTVLSTNWKEVGNKTVESTPPDGMELRKWEY